jgi:hypothetical protein
MARRSKIETLGIEAEVLELSSRGLGSRLIEAELRKRGIKVSYSAICRFLSDETKDRQKARKAATAVRAAEIAGAAGEDAESNRGQLQAAMGQAGFMAVHGYRRTGVPEEGIPWTVEKLDAQEHIRAVGEARQLGAYLIELAAGSPRPVDPRDTEAVKKILAGAFGYPEAPGATTNPQEAPPSMEEHQPPVVH